MQFVPKTEQEIRRERILDRGVYPFEWKTVTEKIKVGGGQTFEVMVAISHDGKTYLIRDWLSPERIDKLRQAALVAGVLDRYNQGKLCAADFANKRGHALIHIRPPRGDYPEANIVYSYISKGITK